MVEKVYRAIGKSIVTSLSVSVTMLFMRIVVIAITWVGAKVVQWIFGGYIAHGLNVLFNTTRFTPSQIPVILVVLSIVSTYLITTTSIRVDKD